MNGSREIRNEVAKARVIPVIETMPADLLTPLAVYLKLAGDDGESFLLESVEGGESLARYSFVGVDPEFTVTGNGDRVVVRNATGTYVRDISMIEFLRNHFDRFRLDDNDDLPSFAGGAIGWLGFSCASWFEQSLQASVASSDDEASFMLCRTIVAFDHAKQVIKIVSLVFGDGAGGDDPGLDEACREAGERNRHIRSVLEHGPLEVPRAPNFNGTSAPSSNFEKPDFIEAVKTIKEHIAAGNAYQVVLSQCFSRATSASPVSIYRAVRSLNPSPYMFLIRMNARSMIGASPEMLIRCRGRELEYRPIAGTRPRGTTPAEDSRLAEEMRGDRKEVAEHLMLVDLGRNDLGRVADFGTVQVSGLMSVEKYSHVQHMVTHLSAELRPGLDRFDALAACFPAGTVSGAPKVRAIEIISELEPTPRGIYAGAVGYFDYSGNMDTCIAIRTMSLENGVAKVQAGAGIVADSDHDAEFRETENKAAALLRAIEIAEGHDRRVQIATMVDILSQTIGSFRRRRDLDGSNAEAVLDALIAATDEAMLTDLFQAWNDKGIAEDEIYSLAKIMRGRCIRVNSRHPRFVDIVGTGGSRAKTFNVSTAAALVVAGAGVPVAKHGNRAATSSSGSADVLSALGIEPAVDADDAERCLNEIGICFMFAPNFHRLSATLANVRRSLGFPTIFNCVGPLCNPASTPHQLIGVWDAELVPKMAGALAKLGTGRSWVVHGAEGLDEISLSGTSIVAEVAGGGVNVFEISQPDFGVQSESSETLRTDSPEASAALIREVLAGTCEDSAARALVEINAAAALFVAGFGDDVFEAFEFANDSVRGGHAQRKLDSFVKFQQG